MVAGSLAGAWGYPFPGPPPRGEGGRQRLWLSLAAFTARHLPPWEGWEGGGHVARSALLTSPGSGR
jgi:hypothetical protein